MRAVVQRVTQADVRVEGREAGSIGPGLAVLLGIGRNDDDSDAQWIARKIAELRIFDDHEGKLNLSVQDIGGGVLLVPNFTLYGDARKGRRPSYTDAADFEEGRRLFESCCRSLQSLGVRVEKGVYGATMAVSLTNDGPVTLILDSPGVGTE